jgi:hypothetical protein
LREFNEYFFAEALSTKDESLFRYFTWRVAARKSWAKKHLQSVTRSVLQTAFLSLSRMLIELHVSDSHVGAATSNMPGPTVILGKRKTYTSLLDIGYSRTRLLC